MFTVGPESLPETERTEEAAELMREALSWSTEAPHLRGLTFGGEVYRDTEDPDQFEVLEYIGRVTSIVEEPPAFNLLLSQAWQQTSQCDCPGSDIGMLFEDFEQYIEEVEFSQELDAFAGTPTKDPHFKELDLSPNTEVTVPFDRLGEYVVSGALKDSD